MRWGTIVTVLGFVLPTAIVRADEPVDNDYFERKVRPLLVAHCVGCHGEKKQKGGLRLDRQAGFVQGGESGPAKDLLAKAVQYDGDLKMPPKGKLPDHEIAILLAWVKAGAPWPEDGANAIPRDSPIDLVARAKAHWSFQPIRRPEVPRIDRLPDPLVHEIDRFLGVKLRDAGLSFSPPAEKSVLLRRIYFDLIGLPPTPEEIAAFVNDPAPDAYEKVVDRLLASPHYGERWGRHWLDLVRFAETYGHEFDFEIPEAWRYRDYVVRAFNQDVPYNQFVLEHIAGDLLPHPRRDPKTGINESLLATGFWWLGEAKHSPVDSRAEYADRIDNQIDVFGKAFFGLTLACARCHDHKFDPIRTQDYYALFGILASSRYNLTDVSDPAPIVRQLDELRQLRSQLAQLIPGVDTKPVVMPQAPSANALLWESFDADWRNRWDASGLAFRDGAGVGFPHSGQEVQQLSGELRSPTFTISKPYLVIRVAGRQGRARVILNGLQLIQNPIYGGLAQSINHGEELRWMTFDLRMWPGESAYLELLDDGPGWLAITDAWFAESPPRHEPGGKVALPSLPATDDAAAQALSQRIRELEAKIPAPVRAPTMRDGPGINQRVYIRGHHRSLGEEVPRGTLAVFGYPSFSTSGSGRWELAQTVIDPQNPLVARVIVNRLWKHHFGEGLVRTPDDFGHQGQPPTHPELLDWLASELIAQQWSLKALHRRMVLSTAYRQSSVPPAELAARAKIADPQNRLLHRQNVKRLEAEVIRDAMLAISGRLDRTREGPGILPYLTSHQAGRGRPASGPLDGHGRRSIYLQVRRNFLPPMFTAFDYPTPFTTMGRRTVSNVPAQALVMLNNPFVRQQAELWAKRVLATTEPNLEQRVRRMYEAALGRTPTAEEIALARDFLAAQATEYGRADHPQAWADFAHVLFNTKEFLWIQ
ncbi:MAG: PSD1 and planctomycete cytochrome C domain-containing protein [Gemmataceae bacterium]|nr:PSD1 and planctomycete cytochrome C domain-containing protein [Gemmata sp.]MDW8199103.1 PSD1 and planctomycete cytochrome C domain-containing protein [Gemmataceae bacterium]